MLIDRNTPKSCLENPDLFRELPEECRFAFKKYIDCKHGQADMRTRFRGNGPLSTGKYDKELAQLSKGEVDMEQELKILQGNAKNA